MTDTKQTSAITDATAAPRSGRLPAAQDSGPSDTPVRNGHLIGYARVSTRAQDLALQLDACLEQLLPGDTLVVWRLDRPGRSLRHLIDVITGLQQREIAFRSLRESIDTTTATGRLQLHLFAALAEFERELIRERSTAGRDAARARGRQGGRPSVITAELLAAATAMRDKRELTMAQIARTLKIGRSTLYKHLDINHETNTEHDLAA